MLRLAEIVGFAHRLDPPIVHRDLKPANVLVQKKDKGIVLKVADFGIGGVVVGQAVAERRGDSTKALLAATVARGSYSVLYASPQQMAGLPADPRDDVYALGVLWYQLLTGDLAKGRPGGSRWRERLEEKGLPATMVRLLEDCFEDDPEDRPKDAADLAARLVGLLTPTSAATAAPKPKQEETLPRPKTPLVPPSAQTEGRDQELAEPVQTVSTPGLDDNPALDRVEEWERLVQDTCDQLFAEDSPPTPVPPVKSRSDWQRGGQSEKPCCPECGYLDYNPAHACRACGYVAEGHSKPPSKGRFGWFK
jgi:serine/threonine protein kinase